MKRITVGVAGHVDHGKTALVHALTGTDTDRLKEEKERGMSIALGFAHLDFAEGEVDLIDVPGHERLVKTVISGATGIEAVVLVVEANELVKPQTVEHLELTDLLGVRKGIVAITKSDLIPREDAELRALVLDDLRSHLRGTFLENAPRLFTSVRTGEGVEALRIALGSLLEDGASPDPDSPFFYLPIDRVFSLPGHGTIVTGTLRRGALRVGQTVEIVGQSGKRSLQAEIRSLQVHNRAVDEVAAGGRVAVNLRGIKTEEIAHGDALATPGFLWPARWLDVALRLSPSAARPITTGQLVRFYFGTTEGVARVYPLDRAEIRPGDSAPAQLRLRGGDAVVALPFRERFVLRTFSSGESIAGGIVADAGAAKHGCSDPAAARRVLTLAHGTVAEMLAAKIEEAGYAGCEVAELARALALSPERVKREARDLAVVLCADSLIIPKPLLESLGEQSLAAIDCFHTEFPAREGLDKEALRAALPSNLPLAAFHRLLETLRRAGSIEVEETTMRRAGFRPARALSADDLDVARTIALAFRDGGLTPPSADIVLGTEVRRAEIYRLLVKSGILIAAEDPKESRTIVFHRDAVADAERLLRPHFTGQGITTPEANKILGITRKFGIPLLEHLDARGITRRVGDRRVAGVPVAPTPAD